jgi:hypothetical protein
MVVRRIGGVLGTVGLVLMLSGGGADARDAAADAGVEHCAVNAETGEGACAADRVQAQRLVAPLASYQLVTLYDLTGFHGSSMTWYGSAPCTSSYDPEYADQNLKGVNGYNLNNWASSARTYNRCDVKLYDDWLFYGAEPTWIDEASNLGSVGSGWSNRADSIRIS